MKQFQLHSQKGLLGEALARRYLIGRGHTVLAENYYYEKGRRSGEIDLITLYKRKIHFTEVKTRYMSSSEPEKVFSFPIEAQVTPAKVQKCFKTAQHYLRVSHQEHCEYHFDVITVLYNAETKEAKIRYLEDVFY